MNKYQLALSAASVFSVFVLHTQSGVAQPVASAQVRFVVAGVQAARVQFPRVQATLKYQLATPKLYYERQKQIALNPHFALSPGQKKQVLKMQTNDREVTSLSTFSYEAPNVAIEHRADPKVAAILRFDRVVVKGNLAYALEQYDKQEGQSNKPNDESGYYSFGYIRPSTEIMKDGLIDNSQLSDPRYYCYYDRLGNEPIDQRLLRPDFKAVYRGEEVMNGSRCMKVEVSFLQDAKILYWIDVEHNFLLRRREERTYDGEDLLRDETIVPEVQESNGVWLPKTIEIREFLDPVKAKVGQSPEVDPSKVVLTRVTISDFKANTDIPTSTFVMKWPKGTNVRNQITQTGFVADGEQTNKGDQLQPTNTDATNKADTNTVKSTSVQGK